MNQMSHKVTVVQNDINLMQCEISGIDFENDKLMLSIEIYMKTVWRIGTIVNGFKGDFKELLLNYGGEIPEEVDRSDNLENIVTIAYDSDELLTEIRINDQPFDTSRIKGREIEDWVCPFVLRKIKWDGVFEELKNVIGNYNYRILFSGSSEAKDVLYEECPDSVTIEWREEIDYLTYENENDEVTDDYIECDDYESTIHSFAVYGYGGEEKYKLHLAQTGRSKYEVDIDYWKYTADYSVFFDYAENESILSFSEANSDECSLTNIYQERFNELMEEASMGEPVSERKIGECYYYGIGIEIDFEEAFYWFNEASKQNDVKAKILLGICYENGSGVDIDEEKTFDMYNEAALLGDSTARLLLGRCYENSVGVYMDMEEAVKWYLLSASQFNAEAQYEVARCYYCGDGVKHKLWQSKMQSKTFKFLKKSAELGYIPAQIWLGNIYRYGQLCSVGVDYEKAFYWYNKAAMQSSEVALYKVGVCYEKGLGVEKNYKEAGEQYYNSAISGYAPAQKKIGECYEHGSYGFERNMDEAFYWYKRAAENGDSDAQRTIGIYYEYGKGVEIDYEEAVYWYRQAAEQGDEDAQRYLEELDA